MGYSSPLNTSRCGDDWFCFSLIESRVLSYPKNWVLLEEHVGLSIYSMASWNHYKMKRSPSFSVLSSFLQTRHAESGTSVHFVALRHCKVVSASDQTWFTMDVQVGHGFACIAGPEGVPCTDDSQLLHDFLGGLTIPKMLQGQRPVFKCERLGKWR